MSCSDPDDPVEPVTSTRKNNNVVKKTQKDKHKCLLSETSRTTISCRPGAPAILPVHRVKLHYMIHYIQRGTWDHIVPLPSEEEKRQIEGYACKLCNVKFRNSLEKEEYPGRKSLLCHIAGNHGKLWEAMRDEDEFNVGEAIELLKTHDKPFAEDSKTESLPKFDSSMVEIKRTTYTDGLNGTKDATEVKETPQRSSSSVEPAELTNSDNDRKYIYATLYECPFCMFKNKSGDRRSLRFHFYNHYKESWRDKAEELFTGELETNCDKCRRRIAGATADGWKNSMICHLAIQHNELKDVMLKDGRLDPNFVEDLLQVKEPEKQIIGKVISNLDASSPEQQIICSSEKTPGPRRRLRAPPAVNFSDESSRSREEEEEEEEEEEAEDRDTTPPVITKKRSSSHEVMRVNKEYIRKRKKIKLTVADLEDDDGETSEEDEVFIKKVGTIEPRRNRPKRSVSKPVRYNDEVHLDFDDE